MTVDGPLAIERVPWDALKPHPRNARNGDLDAIMESIRVNGVYRPIICAADGTILAGHHLWFALGELNIDKVDVVTLPVHPDSSEAIRIMLADNRIADLGIYDDGLLLALLTDLGDESGLIGTGYSEDDLTLLLNKVIDPPPINIDDPIPEQHGPTCPQCGYTFPLGVRHASRKTSEAGQ